MERSESPKRRSSRTVRPDGERIRNLRHRLGYSLEELADRAMIGRNTLLRIEQGKPVLPATLRDLAKALDVSHPLDLIAKDSDNPEEPQVNPEPTSPNPIRRVEVTITLPDDFDQFNESRLAELMAIIAKASQMSDVKIVSVRKG